MEPDVDRNEISDPVNLICIFCNTGEAPNAATKLKTFNKDIWESAKRFAKRRLTLVRDKYSDATKIISNSENGENVHYHSKCHSQYCAVKRTSSTIVPSEPAKKSTRSNSDLPESNSRGVLQKLCLFCGQKRKRKLQEDEPLRQCMQKNGSKAIIKAAREKDDVRIIALGEDLIAKEAFYHDSCRRDYVRSKPAEDDQKSNRKMHVEAFDSLSCFIAKNIIKEETPMLASVLFNLYKEEFITIGGTQNDINNYTIQSFLAKLTGKFNNLCVKKQAHRGQIVVFPSSLSYSDAVIKLNESNAKEDEIRSAAMSLRGVILAMTPSKTPTPTSVYTLEQNSPDIPNLLSLFFRTLIGGLNQESKSGSSISVIDTKTQAMSSDAIYNCTRGNVRPWKNISVGIGIGALTGSKSVMKILNRLGHSISYDEVKRLETEMAYTSVDGTRETPAGLHLVDGLGTGSAWDNYDVNTETLDGKDTLHSTVGITYQNESSIQLSDSDNSNEVIHGRMRRRYDGIDKPIPPFLQPLRKAQFAFNASLRVEDMLRLGQMALDFVWLLRSISQKLPLFNGFLSQFVTDERPKTIVTYMDPISLPPTRNDVVQETMVRSLKVAEEVKQEFAVVTYDLAVALKAYSIQALQAPKFDKLVILLGNFHLELAFFGALGTYLADSGVEYLLTESGVLAEGSLSGVMKGKFYNRCTRIHQILACVLERALFSKYTEGLSEEEKQCLETVQSESAETIEDHVKTSENPDCQKLLQGYEKFFNDVIDGKHGTMSAYWGLYVYLVNRVYRELQRAVRTNNVKQYIHILPSVIEVFFALNRPNYARWGCLFLHKLQQLHPKALEVLEIGAMSIRRTQKSYARCAVDLTLEQTVNKDAASPLKGIPAFRNSESAFRRWCVTLTQRGMALSKLRELVGLQMGEEPGNQLKPWRIARDNADIESLTAILNNTCHPFTQDTPSELVNISSGKKATEKTQTFLLGTLKRGNELRVKFEAACSEDGSRFLKPISRIPMSNFASENIKQPKSMARKVDAAEGVRDVFGRILALASQTNKSLDLRTLLSYPITSVPLSLAHSDGTPLKTDKATLITLLENKQGDQSPDADISQVKASILDGGIILHETILRHSKSTYATMAKDVLTKTCSYRGNEIHLVLDTYKSPSIKDVERKNRGAVAPAQGFVITGPDQAQRQSGKELLKNTAFKQEFSRFLMEEYQKPEYGQIIGGKTVYISHGGKSIMLSNTNDGVFETHRPTHLQGDHEEADTLIAFHAKSMSSGHVLVRSTDTDVVVILLGLSGKYPNLRITLDFGTGNYRRYINISKIANVLNEKHQSFTEGLIGLHALTGNDYVSCFFGKGKVKPFQLVEEDETHGHLIALRTLTTLDVDISGVTVFVTAVYGKKSVDIDEARFNAFMRISGGNVKTPLSKIKKINCASLPPCSKTLINHIKRAQFVARLWNRAHLSDPTQGEKPCEFGWTKDYEPDWYPGQSIPENVTCSDSDDESGDDLSENEWSEDSGDSDDDVDESG